MKNKVIFCVCFVLFLGSSVFALDFYDDCGNPGNQPNLVQGHTFSAWTDIDPATTEAQKSINYHTDCVIYSYTGLKPINAYQLKVTYLQQTGETRHQSLYADGTQIHGDLALPTYTAVTYTYYLPEKVYEDGNVILYFYRLSGPNAVVSEIWLTKVPAIVNILDTPDPFNPNTGTTTITTDFSESDDWNWTITIKDSEDNTVRTFSGSDALKVSQEWDGKNDSGSIVKDGKYTYQIAAVNDEGGNAKPGIGTVVVSVLPVAILTAPTSGISVPETLQIIGTATSVSFQRYEVSYGIGGEPESWIPIITSTTPIDGDVLATWDTKDLGLAGQLVTIRLIAKDTADNETVTTVQIIPSSLKLTQIKVAPSPFDPTSEECAISYTLSSEASVSVQIYNLGGRLIKTLSQPNAMAGENVALWDGKEDSGKIVPPEAYTFTITAIDINGNQATYDPPFSGGEVPVTNIFVPPEFNPYINQPYQLSYTLSEPARVTVRTGVPGALTATRTLINSAPRNAGNNYEAWDGRDDSGQLVPKDQYIAAFWTQKLPNNTIIVEGKPFKIANISAYLIIPTHGDITTVTYDVPKKANVEVTVIGPSVAKTLLNAQQDAGSHSIIWDGTDSNGLIAATEGLYEIAFKMDGILESQVMISVYH
jgi:flagellar hook assembly protein FlgD